MPLGEEKAIQEDQEASLQKEDEENEGPLEKNGQNPIDCTASVTKAASVY